MFITVHWVLATASTWPMLSPQSTLASRGNVGEGGSDALPPACVPSLSLSGSFFACSNLFWFGGPITPTNSTRRIFIAHARNLKYSEFGYEFIAPRTREGMGCSPCGVRPRVRYCWIPSHISSLFISSFTSRHLAGRGQRGGRQISTIEPPFGAKLRIRPF